MLFNETFGEAVERIGTPDQVVSVLNEALYEGQAIQPEPLSDAEEHEVWDGAFVVEDSKVFYVGSDGPSGGTHQERRQLITSKTVINYY